MTKRCKVCTIITQLIIQATNMNKKDSIKAIILIALLSYSSYKLGQGNPIVTEKTVEVEVTDKGFCVACHKKHTWDEMYVIVNEDLQTEYDIN